MSNNFYPRISDLLSIQSIPVYLQSILNIENGVLSNIFYRNLQFLNSADNSSSSHRIELILPNSIDLPIFNSGIDLVLNADPLDPMNSTFILELEYTLPIKKYISTFQSIKSTLAANDILDLFSKAFNIDEINLLTNYIREFELNSDNDPIVTFIDDINTKFNLEPSIKYPDVDLSIEEQIKNVHSDLRSINFNLVEYLLSEKIDNNIESAESVVALIKSVFNEGDSSDVLDLIIPKVKIGVADLNVSLRFPTNFLYPVDENLDYSLLTFDIGSLYLGTETGIVFNNESNLNFTQSYIGNTGFTIGFTNCKFDFSKTSSIEEAELAGYDNEFIGVFVESAAIGLPDFFSPGTGSTTSLIGTNLLIGTGGLSGTIGLDNPEGFINVELNQFKISITDFDIVFKQGKVVSSEIKGLMTIPGFENSEGEEAEIEIDIHIGDEGDFMITASETEGITAISIPDVLDLKIYSLSVGKEDDKFFVATSGLIDFTATDGGSGDGQGNSLLPQDVPIKKLIIWEDGKMEIEGGAIILPKVFRLNLGPVQLSVSAIHFGSHEQVHEGELRQYNFFGFDGSVALKPKSVQARGEGIKFYYTVDNSVSLDPHRFIRVDGIGVEIRVPADATDPNVWIKGYLAVKDTPASATGDAAVSRKSYVGDIEFSFNKPGIKGGAGMI